MVRGCPLATLHLGRASALWCWQREERGGVTEHEGSTQNPLYPWFLGDRSRPPPRVPVGLLSLLGRGTLRH